jgi:hypothetical protein
VSLLAAPVLISLTLNLWVALVGTGCIVVIFGAVWYSKRGGFGKKAASVANF